MSDNNRTTIEDLKRELIEKDRIIDILLNIISDCGLKTPKNKRIKK